MDFDGCEGAKFGQPRGSSGLGRKVKGRGCREEEIKGSLVG